MHYYQCSLLTFIADLPSFYSRTGVGFLDPHEKYFISLQDPRASTYLWKITEKPNCPWKNLLCMKMYSFELFQSSYCEEYNGTLFRFPLRLAQTDSMLSQNAYSTVRVLELLKTLSSEAYMNLLFMKNIENIEIHHKPKGQDFEKLHFKVQISPQSLDLVRSQREEIAKHLKNVEGWGFEPKSASLDIEVQDAMINEMSQDKKSLWHVCHYIDGGSRDTVLKDLASDEEVGLLPWVAVATRIDDVHVRKPIKGHVFCVLPLPVTEKSPSGLPVHVHGHFALDHNRHHVKWPTEEELQRQLLDKSLLWNQTLMKETVPEALFQLLLALRNKNLPHILTDSLPIHTDTEPFWKDVLPPLYEKISTKELFFSTEGNWVKAQDSLLVNTATEIRTILLKILLQTRQCTVDLSPKLEETVKHYKLPFHEISLGSVKGLLLKENATELLNRNEKINLLEAVLSDRCYDELDGIPLLPLSNGEFGVFQSGEGEPVYVYYGTDDIFSILPGTKAHFVDVDSFPAQHLKDILSGKL